MFLDIEQLKAQMSVRTLAYAAITLYLAAVLAEIIKRMIAGVKRPPMAFLLVRSIHSYSVRSAFIALRSTMKADLTNLTCAHLVKTARCLLLSQMDLPLPIIGPFINMYLFINGYGNVSPLHLPQCICCA
jgi:hypothetical protein